MIAVTILTYLHIVFGEMVPKALALQRAHDTVLYVSPVIRALERALLPLVIALNAFGNGLLRLVGIKRQRVERERYHTAEELQYIVEESEEGGLLRGESGQLLRDLFEFGDRTAGEAMVPRVLLVGIPVGAEPDELRAIVAHAGAHAISRLQRRPRSHRRQPPHQGSPASPDLESAGHRARRARAALCARARRRSTEVLAAMRRYRAQMAVVMDQHGGTAGLVTMEDLFEEVIGDIEEGRGRAAIVREANGAVRVRGTVRLDEVAKSLDWPLEHPKVTTVSGLVLLLLGRPALLGDVVTWNHVRVEVTKVAGRGVAEALLTRDAPPS